MSTQLGASCSSPLLPTHDNVIQFIDNRYVDVRPIFPAYGATIGYPIDYQVASQWKGGPVLCCDCKERYTDSRYTMKRCDPCHNAWCLTPAGGTAVMAIAISVSTPIDDWISIIRSILPLELRLAPTFVVADWLEEHGRQIEANYLRRTNEEAELAARIKWFG